MKNKLTLIPIASALFVLLAGCGCDPKTKVLVVEPEAVIDSKVYVRQPLSAYEKKELGGAAFRQEGFEYTLDDCHLCTDPREVTVKTEESAVQTVTTAAAPAKPKAAPKRTAKAAKGKNRSIYRKAKAKPKQTKPVIDCELYKKYCEGQGIRDAAEKVQQQAASQAKSSAVKTEPVKEVVVPAVKDRETKETAQPDKQAQQDRWYFPGSQYAYPKSDKSLVVR